MVLQLFDIQPLLCQFFLTLEEPAEGHKQQLCYVMQHVYEDWHGVETEECAGKGQEATVYHRYYGYYCTDEE